MEEPRRSVLSHLDKLEMQANSLGRRQRKDPQQRSQEAEEGKITDTELLKATLQTLLVQRDQLKAKIKADTKRIDGAGDGSACEGEEDEDVSENSHLQLLMAQHTQLKDLLRAHHLIGGYDVIQTRNGKGVCVSLATAYEGVYLETYNLEVDLATTVRISRHNIPPSVPLETLVRQSDMQRDIRAFLDTLSRHLNAYAGRKQQLSLIKKLLKSVQVMESNVLCTILVLMFKLPGDKPTALLCTLEYGDHTGCLPTQVKIESEDEVLADSLQQEKYRALFLEKPVHKALLAMRGTGMIV